MNEKKSKRDTINRQIEQARKKFDKNMKREVDADFVRLQLIYADDLSQIGLDLIEQLDELIKAANAEQRIQANLRLTKFCEDNQIFFYKSKKPAKKMMIPRRKMSSKVEVNGTLRGRGSMLHLLYDIPVMEDISKGQAKDKTNKR